MIKNSLIKVTSGDKPHGEAGEKINKNTAKTDSYTIHPKRKRQIMTKNRSALYNSSSLTTRLVTSFVLSMAGISVPHAAMADGTLPMNPVDVSGSNSYNYSNNQLDIIQHTQSTVVDWRGGFNIGSDAGVNVAQPNTGSIALYKD